MTTNLHRADIELVRCDETDLILRKDAPLFSKDVKQFIIANSLSYYVLINTWLMLVKNYSRFGWMRLHDAITRKGLVAVIAQAQTSADEVVHGNPISDGLFSGIYADVQTSITNVIFTPSEELKMISKDAMATILFLLRYPKRFTPVGNDITNDSSIKDFVSVERRTKSLQRVGYSQLAITYVIEAMGKLVDWNALDRAIDNSIKDNRTFDLPTGAGFDANSSVGAKLVAISRTNPEAFMRPFGFPVADLHVSNEPEVWGKYVKDTVRPVKVVAVPKTYKSSRIIAMEPTYSQARAKVVSSVVDDYLPSSIPIHDQTQNQVLAKFGSETGKLATVDLSHASDTISKMLAETVFPDLFWQRVKPLLGTHTVINDTVRLMQQMSTAGNALTFRLESLVFLAIAKASAALHTDWTHDDLISSVEIEGCSYPVPSVYGDDIVVDARCEGALLYLLEALGFIVNESKSYFTGAYRESCGVEYWNGIDVSSYYYPRFPIQGTISKQVNIDISYRRDSWTGELSSSLTSLIALQHRLYGVSLDASYLIACVVREAFPKMTMSPRGTLLDDLWEYDDTFEKRYAPAAEVVVEKGRYASDSKRIFRRVKLESQVRTAKFLPSVKYKLERDVPANHLRLFELWKYQRFLEVGPRYEDPFLKSLSISSPPLTVEEAFGKPTVIVGYREVDYK
jgi:hypothetical protein